MIGKNSEIENKLNSVGIDLYRRSLSGDSSVILSKAVGNIYVDNCPVVCSLSASCGLYL